MSLSLHFSCVMVLRTHGAAGGSEVLLGRGWMQTLRLLINQNNELKGGGDDAQIDHLNAETCSLLSQWRLVVSMSTSGCYYLKPGLWKQTQR